jgi:hypothetical protein
MLSFGAISELAIAEVERRYDPVRILAADALVVALDELATPEDQGVVLKAASDDLFVAVSDAAAPAVVFQLVMGSDGLTVQILEQSDLLQMALVTDALRVEAETELSFNGRYLTRAPKHRTLFVMPDRPPRFT